MLDKTKLNQGFTAIDKNYEAISSVKIPEQHNVMMFD